MGNDGRVYRLSGGPNNPTDLWYDSSNRLIRQEFSELGHRTVILLNAIQRP